MVLQLFINFLFPIEPNPSSYKFLTTSGFVDGSSVTLQPEGTGPSPYDQKWVIEGK